MKKTSSIFAIIILIITSFSLNCFAQNDTKEEMIKKFVQIMGDQIIDVAKNKKLNESQKKQKIINIVDKNIDAKWIGRFVLGKHYKTASEEQRKNFLDFYRQFMINTYGPKFSSYDGKKFTVLSIDKQNNFYLVKSEFIPNNSNNVIFFDFRIIENEGLISVVDFIAEGVSLIETQRSEFNASINENGLDKFLENLKLRIAELKKDNVQAKAPIKK
jgi:phospholipid transport system substrate-binding protein